jgi:hypothetical protein
VSAPGALPNVAQLLGPLLQRVPAPQRPLLLAIAERLAAERYRGWAELAGSAEERARFLACAAREEEIAGRIEGLVSDAAGQQRAILAANPDLAELNRAVFEGRPLAQQLAIQAAGERAGAALWRSFAGTARSEAERAVYLACVRLEEESALFLESLAS